MRITLARLPRSRSGVELITGQEQGLQPYARTCTRVPARRPWRGAIPVLLHARPTPALFLAHKDIDQDVITAEKTSVSVL